MDAISQRQHLVKADFEIALELATQLFIEDGKITRTELNAPFAIIARANGSGADTSGGEGGTRSPTPLGHAVLSRACLPIPALPRMQKPSILTKLATSGVSLI